MSVKLLRRYSRPHTSAGALSACSDLIRITSKTAYELFDPLKSCTLVVKAIVCFVTCFAQFFGSCEACETQSVAVYINTCMKLL